MSFSFFFISQGLRKQTIQCTSEGGKNQASLVAPSIARKFPWKLRMIQIENVNNNKINETRNAAIMHSFMCCKNRVTLLHSFVIREMGMNSWVIFATVAVIVVMRSIMIRWEGKVRYIHLTSCISFLNVRRQQWWYLLETSQLWLLSKATGNL